MNPSPLCLPTETSGYRGYSTAFTLRHSAVLAPQAGFRGAGVQAVSNIGGISAGLEALFGDASRVNDHFGLGYACLISARHGWIDSLD